VCEEGAGGPVVIDSPSSGFYTPSLEFLEQPAPVWTQISCS